MNNRFKYILFSVLVAIFASCSDDDSFTMSRNHLLTMEMDTVKMDTVFSRVPVPAKSFWIHNNSGDGIRCSNIRLEKGNQSGFRVNVDGIYLGETYGFQTNDVEIRKGDSIRVFVELTAPNNNKKVPTEIEDNIIFSLESGVRQIVNLNAWSWDADLKNDIVISSDSVIDNSDDRPLVVRGNVIVNEGATLTLAAGTTIYFHDNSGIIVNGRLISQGTSDKNVVLRGDRLDNMFDYLPYDMLPGRWQGIVFKESSYDNLIDFTDIHSACNAIVADSSNVERRKLTLSNSTVHNCQGTGLSIRSSKVDVINTQITNTQYHCVDILGGDINFLHCTIGQFYVFEGARGKALKFVNAEGYPLINFDVRNSIITGYSSDEIIGEANDTTTTFSYYFAYSLLRTPEVDDTLAFVNVIWENAKDTTCAGDKNFVKIDTDVLRYDFHLSDKSKARSTANKLWSFPYDRDGIKPENDSINMGCFY